MWAFKKVSAVAFVTLISACTSTNLGAGNSDGNWTAAITFAEMKNQCSVGGALPVPPKTSEETAAAALAPLIAELGTSLLGAVGAAISEAGQENLHQRHRARETLRSQQSLPAALSRAA